MEELIYNPDAKIEIREAAVFYESCRKNLGLELLNSVDSEIEKVMQFPEAWRKISGDFRRIRLHRFPYGIIYSFRDDLIYVVAFMHLKRKPGYWMKRIQGTEPTG